MRQDDVSDQAARDGAEGCGDDDADGHVQHVAPHDEFLELTKEALLFFFHHVTSFL